MRYDITRYNHWFLLASAGEWPSWSPELMILRLSLGWDIQDSPSTPLVHVCHCQKNDTLDILNIQGKNTVSFHGLHGLHVLLSLFPSFQIQIRLKRPSIQRGEADLGAIDQVLEREVAKLSHDPQLSPRVSILSHGLQSWGYHTWGTPKNGWKNNL